MKKKGQYVLRIDDRKGLSFLTRGKSARAIPAVVGILLAALAGAVAPVAAIQVSPTYQVFEAKPGGKADGQMTVTNNEGEDITIIPSVKEWFRLNANSSVKVEDWLRLDDKKPFTLKNGESRVVTYKLVPPRRAKGELAGAVTFSTKPKADMITMLLSVVQYVGIKGSEKLSMEIAGLGINISSNTDVGVALANTGNVHVRPHGYVYIDDADGHRLLNAEIQIGQPTFPGAQNLYTSTVKGYRLSPGKYTARIELSDVDRNVAFPVTTKKFTVTSDGKVEVR